MYKHPKAPFPDLTTTLGILDTLAHFPAASGINRHLVYFFYLTSSEETRFISLSLPFMARAILRALSSSPASSMV